MAGEGDGWHVETGYDEQISNYTEHKKAIVGEGIYKYGKARKNCGIVMELGVLV